MKHFFLKFRKEILLVALLFEKLFSQPGNFSEISNQSPELRICNFCLSLFRSSCLISLFSFCVGSSSLVWGAHFDVAMCGFIFKRNGSEEVKELKCSFTSREIKLFVFWLVWIRSVNTEIQTIIFWDYELTIVICNLNLYASTVASTKSRLNLHS